MKALIVVALLLTFVPCTASAETKFSAYHDSENATRSPLSPKRRMQNKVQQLRQELRAERNKKTSVLAVEICPLSSLIIPSVGLSFGTVVFDDHWLEFGYTYGVLRLKNIAKSMGAPSHIKVPAVAASHQQDANKVYDDVQRLEIYHSLFAARIKTFWTDSFYSNLGLGIRQIGLNYPVDEVSEYNGLDAKISISKPVINIAAGNRWTFANLMLGVDWASASIPFGWLKGESEKLGPTSKRVNRFANTPSLSLFTVQTGIVF